MLPDCIEPATLVKMFLNFQPCRASKEGLKIMKSSTKLLALATAVIAASFIQSADAHKLNAPVLLDPVSEHIDPPARALGQPGTAKLQEKVLSQINVGLVNGQLSSAAAADFKRQIDELSDNESWYKSLNSAVPDAVVEKNAALLNQLSDKINSQTQPKLQLPIKAGNSLHSDIDDLIGRALAHDYITSSEAEKYYLRLAQIESILENSKHNPAMTAQSDQAHKQLNELRSELNHARTAKVGAI